MGLRQRGAPVARQSRVLGVSWTPRVCARQRVRRAYDGERRFVGVRVLAHRPRDCVRWLSPTAAALLVVSLRNSGDPEPQSPTLFIV